MISHVYLSAVLMLAALPVVWCQCTTSRCQDSKYEPPRWENGAVYLESLLTETSERILGAVESRLADQTATMASRLADQTATMESRLAKESVTIENRLTEAVDARLATLKADLENSTTGHLEALESRLAQHTEAVDARLATLKTELENTTTNRSAALEERMVVENRILVTNSESRLNLTIGAMMNNVEERMVVENRNVTTKSESRLSITIGSMMTNMESRLADQTATLENRLADQTATLERHLAQQAEAMDVHLATLKTDLENSTTVRLEALEARMTVENHNLTNNLKSQLNLSIDFMINNVEDSRTALGSSFPNAHLQILKLLVSRDQVTFLRRVDGSANFTRDWADYRSGFGDVGGEYWLGLETLHQLSTQHDYGLRVDMEDFSGERKWASYRVFRVGSEAGKYTLTVTGYNRDSTAGNSMTYENGTAFSTIDRDNDLKSGGNWW